MEEKTCENCGSDLKEIGGIGKSIQITDHKRNVVGVEEVKLYQCPECKIVVLTY